MPPEEGTSRHRWLVGGGHRKPRWVGSRAYRCVLTALAVRRLTRGAVTNADPPRKENRQNGSRPRRAAKNGGKRLPHHHPALRRLAVNPASPGG